jgi:uncharacterized membrane protein YciS (DUF1049 family)
MLSHRLDANLLRAVLDGTLLFVLLLIALAVGAVAHFSQVVAPSSFWFRATVQVVEACGFITAALLAAAVILRVFRVSRSEWRRTFRGGQR